MQLQAGVDLPQVDGPALRPPAVDTQKPPAADLQTHRGFWIQRDIDAGSFQCDEE